MYNRMHNETTVHHTFPLTRRKQKCVLKYSHIAHIRANTYEKYTKNDTKTNRTTKPTAAKNVRDTGMTGY